jgi:hypothetical protein
LEGVDRAIEQEVPLLKTFDKSFSRKHTPVSPANIIIAPAKYANGLKNSSPVMTIIPITILVRFKDFIFISPFLYGVEGFSKINFFAVRDKFHFSSDIPHIKSLVTQPSLSSSQ